jgi:signal transduction histidine kinase/ActR/RegA family two-component response regulator
MPRPPEPSTSAAQARRPAVNDVLDAIDQGFALFDEDDCLVLANPVYKQMFAGVADIIVPGVPFETLLRTAARRRQNVEAIDNPEEWVQCRLAKHRSASGVYEHKFSDGRWIQVRERKTALRQTIGTYTDVTPLVRRSEDLALARDRFAAVSRRMKAMVEASSDWIWTSDACGSVTCERPSARPDDGFDPAPHIAAALRALIRQGCGQDKAPETAPVGRVVHPVHLGDGRTLSLKISGKAVYTEDGVFEGLVGTASDETEKIRAQLDVARHAAVLERVLDSIPTGVVVLSADRRVVMSNRQAEDLLGAPIREGDALLQLQASVGSEIVDGILQWSAAAQGREMETAEFVTPAGTNLLVRAGFMSTGGFVITFADVTEQRRAAMLNHQSQKLMALGELTGGVAHEFNNLLTSISGFAHMARQQADKADKADVVADCLDEVIGAARRAADLTRQMLVFSRKDRFEEKTIVAADIARSLARMMKPLLPETVNLAVAIDDETTCIKVDVAQMSQAVMNLVLNARDAMPEGGTVALRVRPGAGPDGADPGRWLVYAVADEGEGIDAATLPRIFDPFFTTKAPGKGTGLGLSVVHGIVRRSGGAITVESTVGGGSTFSIHLPVAAGEADAPAQAEPLAVAAGGCGRSVVVVEDAPDVRRLVVKALEAQGHRVMPAADHAGLAELLARDIGPPDLLVTDVVLPGRSGPEIAAEMRQRFPRIRVLFMSGYVAPGIQSLGLIGEDAAVLSKPFAPEDLCRAVSDVLGACTGDSGQGRPAP